MSSEQFSARTPTIDVASNIPYYVQLIDIIKAMIQARRWKPAAKFRGALAWCSSDGVNRTVVCQALSELKLEGRLPAPTALPLISKSRPAQRSSLARLFLVELLRSHNHDQVPETNELPQSNALIS